MDKQKKTIRGDKPVPCEICGKTTAPIYFKERGPFCALHYFEAFDAEKTKSD